MLISTKRYNEFRMKNVTQDAIQHVFSKKKTKKNEKMFAPKTKQNKSHFQ